MLFGPINAVVDRIRTLNAIAADDPGLRSVLNADVPRLQSRVKLLHWFILPAICAGVVTTLPMISAFATALLIHQHAFGSALLFILTQAFLLASWAVLAREVASPPKEFDPARKAKPGPHIASRCLRACTTQREVFRVTRSLSVNSCAPEKRKRPAPERFALSTNRN